MLNGSAENGYGLRDQVKSIKAAVVVGAILLAVVPAEAQSARQGLLRRSSAIKEPNPASRNWLDQLNAMPENERRARIAGYQENPTARGQAQGFTKPAPRLRPASNPIAKTDARGVWTPTAPRAIPVARAMVLPQPVVRARPSLSEPVILRPLAVAPTVLEDARGEVAAMERVRRQQLQGRPVQAPTLTPASRPSATAALRAPVAVRPAPAAESDFIRASALFPLGLNASKAEQRIVDPPFVAPTDTVRLSPRLESFLAECQNLSRRGLKYQFGSNDPKSGGLDCSGTVQYLLQSHHISAVPRQSNLQYHWLEEKGTLRKVAASTPARDVLTDLKPGDLLFWKDTYQTNRSPNVTHVMIYMGQDTRTGKHLMFGARGSQASGLHGNPVDLFEFDYPFTEGRGEFIAYGSVPGLQA